MWPSLWAPCFAPDRSVPIGIWLAKANNADLLVMDVEGTDGRERGEDQVRRRLSMLSKAS